MAKKYLDYDGLLYFWQKIKTVFVPNTRTVNGKALSTDITLTASDVSALPSSTTIPSPGTGSSYPAMDGTRALGSNAGYARVDHVHPSDTSRVPTSRTINSKALSSNIVLTGSDIAADSTTSTTIAETFAAIEDEFADALDGKVDKVDGKGLSTNDYTTTEKNKLSGIASGAEVNQNAFSNVKVGSTTVAADAKTDTLELVAGTNISLTPDATNDKVTIGFSGTIPTVPNNFGTVKVGSTNVVADTTSDTLELVAGSNVTLTPDATNDKITIAATDTTYSNATTSAAGLMSADDKTKLNGIATGAEVNQNAFSNVAVSGETTIAADSKTDTLTFEGGSNITITTNATTDTVKIATSAEVNQNAFSNVKVGSTTVAADAKTDTLELVAGNCISLTGDATNDKVTIAVSDIGFIQGASTLSQMVSINNTSYDFMKWSARGAASGVCPLNASSKIDSTYLPSYVDDVIEAYARSGQTALSQNWLATGSASGTVITPEAGKIYILMADSGDYAANTQFRWGGSAYVKMADGGVSSITNAEIDTILAA